MERSLFTTGMISELCGVAPRTVTKWIDSGKLRGFRIPGSNDRRVPRDSLVRFLHESGFFHALRQIRPQMRVLLAGVSERDLTAVRGLLPGYEVYRAATLFEAGILLEQEKPGVVVLDGAFGRWECVAAGKLLREKFPGVALAGLPGEDDGRPHDWQAGGFTKLFSRPFAWEALVDWITKEG